MCSRYYTDDLQASVTEEYIAKTEEWFLYNMPDVKDINADLVVNYFNLTNLVEGTFEYQGITYNYVVNADGNLLYTDRGYDVAMDIAHEMIEDKLEFSYEDMEIVTFCKYCIPCKHINNMTEGFRIRETEVWYEDDYVYYSYIPWEYSEKQIEEWVSAELTSAYNNSLERLGIKVYVENYETVTNASNLYNIFNIYPGIPWVELIKKELQEQEYYIMYADEKNILFHHVLKDNGEWHRDKMRIK